MPKSKPLPTQQELHEWFDYSVVTGQLYWKKKIAKKIVVGSEAGYFKDGYRQLKFKGTIYRVHRLIWKLVTGEDPGTLEIDHINGDRSWNAWHNLRLATTQQNSGNKTAYTHKISPGRYGSYQPKLRYKGKNVFVGTFKTEQEALAALKEKHLELYGEFSSYSNE